VAVIPPLVLLGSGTFLVWREVRRGRPASWHAVAGDLLAIAGAVYGAVLTALGPLWPLAAVPALCALAFTVATVKVLDCRRKGAGR
jgi:hypothetical protein